MANIKSAKKRALINTKKAVSNKNFRSELKTTVKKAEFALDNNGEDKAQLVDAAIKKLDRASTKGILHNNNAARKKSQLTKKLQKV